MRKTTILFLPVFVLFAFLICSGSVGANNYEFAQTKKLLASDGAADDYFGSSVSISGDVVAVGAPYDDDNGSWSGSAYVFYRNQGGGNNWGQVKKITASDSAWADNFGNSVSISGDRMVVGARSDDSYTGSAYIFYRNQGGADNWGEVKKITASDGAADDYFGYRVSISGDLVVVGASEDDDNGSSSGSAYIFYRNQGGSDNWGQVKKITASDGAAEDRFGQRVAISGDTVVVGAFGDDSSTGSAYIFYRHQGGSNNWGQVKKITASDGAAYDYFGYAVSISGDRVVVGAQGDDCCGSAYIFYRHQGGADNWGEVQKITASDGETGDQFSYMAVSISGDRVVVGAKSDDSYTGSAYIFYRNQGGADNWGEVQKITASDGAAEDIFGERVSISGDTVVVGAYGDDDNGSGSGSAYVFIDEPQTWIVDKSGGYDFTMIQGCIDSPYVLDGDTCRVNAGTYVENINFSGKNITVKSTSGPGITIIDGNAAGSVVTFENSETANAVLNGFTVQNGLADYGGGIICSSASPTVTNCTISNNTSNASGGGMRNTFAKSTVTNCTFKRNETGPVGYGGGMSNYQSYPKVTNCTFSENSAKNGGGMGNYDSTPIVTNCTFSGNTGTNRGGGMDNYATYSTFLVTPIVTNCTFSRNEASMGSGIGNYQSYTMVTNCILWGDSSDEIYDDGTFAKVEYSDIQGGYTGAGNIDADPKFVDESNGDFHLRQGSPCIDTGTDSALLLPVHDFEGDDRIIDGNEDGIATVDMGVDEFMEEFPWILFYPAFIKKR